MKHCPCIATAFATAAVSLLGLFAFSIRGATQTATAHQGMHGEPTLEKAFVMAKIPATDDRVTAETQMPPETVGENWPKPVEDVLRFDCLLVEQFAGAGLDRSRGFVVIDLQGLARYRFEVEPALFSSQDGDVPARLTATYYMPLTQRLILQPPLEFDAAVQSAGKSGITKGVNNIGLGLRMRYAIKPQSAPRIGIHRLGQLGETADISRHAERRAEDIAVAFGVHLRF